MYRSSPLRIKPPSNLLKMKPPSSPLQAPFNAEGFKPHSSPLVKPPWSLPKVKPPSSPLSSLLQAPFKPRRKPLQRWRLQAPFKPLSSPLQAPLKPPSSSPFQVLSSEGEALFKPSGRVPLKGASLKTKRPSSPEGYPFWRSLEPSCLDRRSSLPYGGVHHWDGSPISGIPLCSKTKSAQELEVFLRMSREFFFFAPCC